MRTQTRKPPVRGKIPGVGPLALYCVVYLRHAAAVAHTPAYTAPVGMHAIGQPSVCLHWCGRGRKKKRKRTGLLLPYVSLAMHPIESKNLGTKSGQGGEQGSRQLDDRRLQPAAPDPSMQARKLTRAAERAREGGIMVSRDSQVVHIHQVRTCSVSWK